MKKLLIEISKNAIRLKPDFFTEKEKTEQWIGKNGVSGEAIAATERRLSVKLPTEYIELLKITNGTAEILTQMYGAFAPVECIDWLTKVDTEILVNYAEMGDEYLTILKNAIVISGINHVHQVLLIQPCGDNKNWQYWEFASYFPGERPIKGIKAYLKQINTFLKEI